MRRFADATTRNREPIVAVLRDVLPQRGDVLEIASGTGQHVVHFAAAFPGLRFQPSDIEGGSRDSIAAWIEAQGVDNVAAPVDLDVTREPWPVERADAIVCINMIHISPWECTVALLRGAAARLDPGAPLFLYGPYAREGRHTSPSNESFDAALRARDPSWGVRDLERVRTTAKEFGMALDAVVPMPANNLSVVFRG